MFFAAPERARTVLNAFLECMYFDKMFMDGRMDSIITGNNPEITKKKRNYQK